MNASYPRTLDEAHWRALAARHHQRIDTFVEPHLARRRHGSKHPVWDFLFDYYTLSPAKLRRWHPGLGVRLTGDMSSWRSVRGYLVTEECAHVDPSAVNTETLSTTVTLLQKTHERPASFGCFGRHEWAMIYRLSTDQTRHSTWPLRLSSEQIAEVVDSAPLRCTHFDAFRFYTDAARPLNVVQPSRETQVDLEQPGCLHANMDLYKWAYRTYPVVGADLLADCFDLACDIRAVDMRAAPYDLANLGFPAIRIETSEGRAEYAEHQRVFAERGQTLRAELIHILRQALDISTRDTQRPLHQVH